MSRFSPTNCLKKYFLIFFFITMIFTLVAIYTKENSSSNNKSESTINRVELPIAKEGAGGISIGQYNTNGNIEKERVFHIKKGQQFSKIISMSNYINYNRSYVLITLIDYMQSPFIINGKKYNSFKFNMESNEKIEIPVKINNFLEGFHDVIFVIFKSPDQTIESKNLALANSLQQVYSIRNNVIVASSKSFEPMLTKTKPINYQTSNTIFDGLFTSKSRENMKIWWTEKPKNKEVNYYLHIGNLKNQNSTTYAIITFLDWRQIPVTKDNKVLYVSLRQNEKKVYKATLEIPTNIEKKEINFTSLIIPQPFSSLENSMDRTPIGEIEQSLRTTIILK